MRYLIDTHTFLWYVLDDSRLSRAAATLISHQTSQVYVSIASLWEIAIKHSLGKLKLTHPFHDFISEQISVNAFTILPIVFGHLVAVAQLPFHHRDPFDRLLIAQAQAEMLPLISADACFDRYAVQRCW